MWRISTPALSRRETSDGASAGGPQPIRDVQTQAAPTASRILGFFTSIDPSLMDAPVPAVSCDTPRGSYRTSGGSRFTTTVWTSRLSFSMKATRPSGPNADGRSVAPGA